MSLPDPRQPRYEQMLAQIVAGLLASGHFTGVEGEGLDAEPYVILSEQTVEGEYDATRLGKQILQEVITAAKEVMERT